jgi:hypothetical protein
MSIILSVSTIIDKELFKFGTPLPFKSITDVPQFLRAYIAKPELSPSKQRTRTLNYNLNETYSLDSEGYRIHKRHIARQQAQLESEAFRQDELEEEIANAPISEAVAKAGEIGQEDYNVDLERQKAELEAGARHKDAVDAVDAAVEEYPNDDAISPTIDGCAPEPDDADDEEIAKPPVAKTSKAKSGKSFVRRDGRYVLASSVELIENEKLFRHRKRQFGVPEKWIVFSKVTKGEFK